MMSYYKQGDWNAICAICGKKYKASELRWNAQLNDWVCEWDWEERHPQERLRAVKDVQKVAWTRPDTTPVYLISHYAAPDLTNPVHPYYVQFGYWV